MTPEKIEVLREMTKNHNDFSDTSLYFINHFAEFPGFIEGREDTENPLLRNALEAIVEKIFVGSKRSKIKNYRSIRYKNTDILHGSLLTNNAGMISFYYFENDEIGLATIIKTRGAEALFSRFSTKTTPENSFSGKHNHSSLN